MRLRPDDAGYPISLRHLVTPPVLDVSGPLLTAGKIVAIVGSRVPIPESRAFAIELAGHLAKHGVVIVSGGATGIDAAAHEAAMDAGGATWVVCGTGRDHVFPPEHAPLFRRVEDSKDSRMIWPFDPSVRVAAQTLRSRNRVLVGLADVVVVIQAHIRSGSRNAAGWARSLERPLWIVPGVPFAGFETPYAGSSLELARGNGRPLSSVGAFCEAVGVPKLIREQERGAGSSRALEEERRRSTKPKRSRAARTLELHKKAGPSSPPFQALSQDGWSADEKLVFQHICHTPRHLDEISQRTCLPVGSAMTALLTLSMRDVVVEGPDGFFRRHPAR